MRSDNTRLVHITTIPGSLNFVRGQVGYMKRRSFEVSVITSPGKALVKFADDEDVPAYSVEMPRAVTPLRDLVAIARMCRILRSIRPHIVHAHTPKGGLLGTISAWICRVPVRIYHVHGLPVVTATGYRRVLLTWSEKVACRLAHKVLCVSHSIRKIAVAEGLCPAWKIKVLLNGSINGVDAAERFNPARFDAQSRAQARVRHKIPADAMVVGFVGRIVRDKGLTELAEAWSSLRLEFPSLYLLLVGGLEPQDPVPPETIKMLSDDPRVIIAGRVSDIECEYLAMDIVALPAYREGFGVVAIEAAAMKLPVVATDIPGCRDAVANAVTGLLVPVRNATALADAIRRYIVDGDLRRRHGESGRKRALQDFRREDIWEALYAEYLGLPSDFCRKTCRRCHAELDSASGADPESPELDSGSG